MTIVMEWTQPLIEKTLPESHWINLGIVCKLTRNERLREHMSNQGSEERPR